MPIAVISIESGMTSPVIRAARKVAEHHKQNENDEESAFARFFSTVATVAFTSIERS
jgi:hypothetical protein